MPQVGNNFAKKKHPWHPQASILVFPELGRRDSIFSNFLNLFDTFIPGSMIVCSNFSWSTKKLDMSFDIGVCRYGNV